MDDTDPVDECLFNLLVEVADQQSRLDCLLAAVARLSAQMPEESQTDKESQTGQTDKESQMQLTFKMPSSGNIVWLNAGLPEEFTVDDLGDALRKVEDYIMAQANYKEIIGNQGWLSFLYGLFENTLDANRCS